MQASKGSKGMGRKPSCVDSIVGPLGMRTWIGVVVGWRLRKGALVIRKCPELPVSGIKGVVGGVQASVDIEI